MGKGKSDVDGFGRISDHNSRQLTEAQQEKKEKLLEEINISNYLMEGSTFDSDRKSKEDILKCLALQKEVDDQTAVAVTKEKESSKRYALVRTPSIENDLFCGGIVGVSDKAAKKKKKKKTRASSTSPERKKDKKKKSKKRKKESKTKKFKKLRRRKGSCSEYNAVNDKESTDGNSESENDVKRSRKKSKRDKKKQRNKKKALSSSSEKSRSRSPSYKVIENVKTETTTEKSPYGYEFRNRSKEKSLTSKEVPKLYNESSQYSSIKNSKNKCEVRGNSQSDKKYKKSNSRYIERKDRRYDELQNLNLKNSNRTRKCRSRERRSHSKYYKSRRSRSHQMLNCEITDERVKNLKRKRNDKYLERKISSSGEKRNRYSQSHSPPIKRQICEHSLSKTAEIDNKSYEKRSRTPKQKPIDNQSKINKSRSRSSSLKESLRKRSLTPLPRTSMKIETLKVKKNFNKKLKSNITNQNNKDNKNDCKKYRSRTVSSSSISTSSSDAIISKSRTPSPKREHYLSKFLNSQYLVDERKNPLSPIKTQTPEKRGSTSHVMNEKRSKGKQCSIVKAEESLENSNEKEEQKKLESKTPPLKIEKKVGSPSSSRGSSELSYSPARRNPERYLDILINTKNEKNKMVEDRKEFEWDRKEKGGKSDRQSKPIVRLQSQSDEESDATERNNEKILDEFQEVKRERELKDLQMLEHLKTGLAAKAKEKIKTIEKLAASTSASVSSNNDGEVSDKPYKRTVRNSLNDFLAANNVAPAVVATCSPTAYNSIPKSPPGAIYPQTLEEIKKEQATALQSTENQNHTESNIKEIIKDNEIQVNCKKSVVAANGIPLSPLASPLSNNVYVMNKERDRKRERDFRERERETSTFNKDRYLDRRQKTSSNFFSGSGIVGGRRNSNSSMLNMNHRQRFNLICSSGVIGAHHHHPHSHQHPHHHQPNHKIINNHHNSASSSSNFFISNTSSTNPHSLMCNHSNNSTNITFNRLTRINKTPLITATQFNNQMLSKQSNSILVNRRDHRTALNLGLSGTPCTNFSNSNLLLTKANTNPHHIHAAAVGHVVGGGHHHQHHHHHHHHLHGQNPNINSNESYPATQITDRILMAASIAAAQRHSLGVHSAVAAANNLNFLQQQNKSKLVIKPFKINDSQPLVAALADSSLVDAIVSKVSTATVAAAESAARRSRSRSRRSQSRNRHSEKTSSGKSNIGRGGGEGGGNRHRSSSHSRYSSSTSSRSRSPSRSQRSLHSHSSQSSSSSHTSSRSSSSSSFGSSRSGTRSPSIPRRRGSPSFLDRRRITRHTSSCDRRH